ncbi:MAG: enoyl-CoA hydratase/isomerase family protein, partial [Hyphomonadaceae bacterium]
MRPYKTILFEVRDAVATVTFDRPEARNSVVHWMLPEVADAMRRAAEDKFVRVLLLTGAGRDFCAGGDLNFYGAEGGDLGADVDRSAFHVPMILRDAQFVSIAAIRGACAGVGMAWAAACDLRICDSSAKFNSAFLAVGMSGEMATIWNVSRLVGAGKARELYFLPAKFDAMEAHRIGLVERVYPAAEFDAGIEWVTAQLLSYAPLALKAVMANFADVYEVGMAAFVARESERAVSLGASEDGAEAFKAFME